MLFLWSLVIGRLVEGTFLKVDLSSVAWTCAGETVSRGGTTYSTHGATCDEFPLYLHQDHCASAYARGTFNNTFPAGGKLRVTFNYRKTTDSSYTE